MNMSIVPSQTGSTTGLTTGSTIGFPISIVIIAKDEEPFMARCIQSVQWADDVVVVVDDTTTDRTAAVARSLGANVHECPWLGWARQKDLGVSLAKHDWVCVIDADEMITPELANSMQQAIQNADGQDGFAVWHDLDFLGILIPSSPSWKKSGPIKLFNRQYSGYDTSLKVHEKVRCNGKVSLLDGKLVHWRGRTMEEYMVSYNRYTTIEAEILHSKGVRANGWTIFLRPILKFLLCYFYRGKCLYGVHGLIDAMLSASADYFRYAKLWEMQNVTPALHPPDYYTQK